MISIVNGQADRAKVISLGVGLLGLADALQVGSLRLPTFLSHISSATSFFSACRSAHSAF